MLTTSSAIGVSLACTFWSPAQAPRPAPCLPPSWVAIMPRQSPCIYGACSIHSNKPWCQWAFSCLLGRYQPIVTVHMGVIVQTSHPRALQGQPGAASLRPAHLHSLLPALALYPQPPWKCYNSLPEGNHMQPE